MEAVWVGELITIVLHDQLLDNVISWKLIQDRGRRQKLNEGQ